MARPSSSRIFLALTSSPMYQGIAIFKNPDGFAQALVTNGVEWEKVIVNGAEVFHCASNSIECKACIRK